MIHLEGEGENSYHNLDFAPTTKLVRWQIDLDDFEKSQDQIILLYTQWLNI
jgi:hypothetical protein